MEPQAGVLSHDFSDPSRLRYEDASLDLHNRCILAAQPLDQEFCRELAVDCVPTGEDVHSGIAMLRPGMQRKMGFSNEDSATDALGSEMMEMFADYGSTSFLGCRNQTVLKVTQVIQHLPVALFQF